MSDLFGELLGILNELSFWRKKKKRSKHETDNNLPKKKLFNPLTIIVLVLFSVLIIIKLIRILIK